MASFAKGLRELLNEFRQGILGMAVDGGQLMSYQRADIGLYGHDVIPRPGASRHIGSASRRRRS